MQGEMQAVRSAGDLLYGCYVRLENLILQKNIQTWEVPFTRLEELFHGHYKVPGPSQSLLFRAKNISLPLV